MLADDDLQRVYLDAGGSTADRLRAVALAVQVDELGLMMGEDGMYAHVVVPLNKSGQGPATDPGEFHHWGCWCGDDECIVGKYGPRPKWLTERFDNARG